MARFIVCAGYDRQPVVTLWFLHLKPYIYTFIEVKIFDGKILKIENGRPAATPSQFTDEVFGHQLYSPCYGKKIDGRAKQAFPACNKHYIMARLAPYQSPIFTVSKAREYVIGLSKCVNR